MKILFVVNRVFSFIQGIVNTFGLLLSESHHGMSIEMVIRFGVTFLAFVIVPFIPRHLYSSKSMKWVWVVRTVCSLAIALTLLMLSAVIRESNDSHGELMIGAYGMGIFQLAVLIVSIYETYCRRVLGLPTNQ